MIWENCGSNNEVLQKQKRPVWNDTAIAICIVPWTAITKTGGVDLCPACLKQSFFDGSIVVL
jgi:hypothetical protein